MASDRVAFSLNEDGTALTAFGHEFRPNIAAILSSKSNACFKIEFLKAQLAFRGRSSRGDDIEALKEQLMNAVETKNVMDSRVLEVQKRMMKKFQDKKERREKRSMDRRKEIERRIIEEEMEELKAERLEAKRLEAGRIEREERVKRERIKKERREKRREDRMKEARRLGAEMLEAERIEREMERMKAERLVAKRREIEKIESERIERERIGRERIESERTDIERVERDRNAIENLERLRHVASTYMPMLTPPVSAARSGFMTQHEAHVPEQRAIPNGFQLVSRTLHSDEYYAGRDAFYDQYHDSVLGPGHTATDFLNHHRSAPDLRGAHYSDPYDEFYYARASTLAQHRMKREAVDPLHGSRSAPSAARAPSTFSPSLDSRPARPSISYEDQRLAENNPNAFLRQMFLENGQDADLAPIAVPGLSSANRAHLQNAAILLGLFHQTSGDGVMVLGSGRNRLGEQMVVDLNWRIHPQSGYYY